MNKLLTVYRWRLLAAFVSCTGVGSGIGIGLMYIPSPKIRGIAYIVSMTLVAIFYFALISSAPDELKVRPNGG